MKYRRSCKWIIHFVLWMWDSRWHQNQPIYIYNQQTRTKPGAALQTALWFIQVHKPFPPSALRRCYPQTVRDSSSSYKIDYVIVIKNFQKSQRASKSHQWFKSYGHFTEGVDLAYWWSFIGGGSAPAACAAGLFLAAPGQNSKTQIVTELVNFNCEKLKNTNCDNTQKFNLWHN